MRARYDAAITDDDNRRHWANADAFSAKSANSPEVRRIVRNRARYERFSNTYLDGLALTIANDTIGTGPRIQAGTPDADLNKRIAEAFEEWACEAKLTQKLHTLCQARTIDGEGFLVFITNPKLSGPVKLSIDDIECDQIATPYPNLLDPRAVDGLKFDEYGNILEYHLLKYHPGDFIQWGFPTDYTPLPARLVLHLFRHKRPKQYRGMSDVLAALPLFAQLRRFTLAVIAAAETAADFAAVLESQLAAESDEDAETEDAFQSLEIVKRMMTTLPAGYKLSQFKAENPSTTYDMFKREVLNEIARCLNIPYNIAAGNSSGYNYSSGRLDHQTYYKSIGVDQYEIEQVVLNPIFDAWVEESRLATDLIPSDLVRLPRMWFWDGHQHVDPVKEAQAEQIRLASGTTTHAEIYANQGYDWRQKIDEEAEVIAYAREKGLPWASAPAARPNPSTNGADNGNAQGGRAARQLPLRTR